MPPKLKTLLLFLLVAYTVSAQRAGFAIEPVLGYGTSASIQNANNKGGERIGCGVVYMFNDHFGVSGGLQIQRYVAEVISGQDSAYMAQKPATNSYEEYNYVSANYSFTYLELPLTIRYISSQDQKVGIFAEAGITLGYLISGSESGSINITDIDTSSGGSESNSALALGKITPKTTAFNFQGHVALGAVNPISGRCALITEVSLNKGFTNVGNSSTDFTNTPLLSPFYYYRSTNFSTPYVSNYGTDFSVVISVRLIIKLDGKVAEAPADK